MKPTPKTLSQWVDRLSEEEMPVFAHTARRIAGISSQPDTSVADLAQVILQDSAMTARVLRMANSVYYNPAGHAISTVSRAVVMLGFDVVRSISLSVAMIDTLLRGKRHERVLAEMARSFHAAIQAKALALSRGELSPEEIFIASLLFRLGPMVFWCFPYDRSQAMEAALKEFPEAPETAERQVLGFTLTQLTGALTREWHLSGLLEAALQSHRSRDPRVYTLELGHAIAASAERGWATPEMNRRIEAVAEFLRIQHEEAQRLVHRSARQAVKTAEEFGAVAVSSLIPLPGGSMAENDTAVRQRSRGDTQLQLSVLRELSAMLSERVDLSALLGMVLEGIYRGIGMDCAVLALVSPDGRRLKAKYVLGSDRTRLMECFSFELGGRQEHVFGRILADSEPVWFSRRREVLEAGLTHAVRNCTGGADFFAMPLMIGGNARGLFYADRSANGDPLEEEGFIGFRHFCEQAVIGFTLLGMRGL